LKAQNSDSIRVEFTQTIYYTEQLPDGSLVETRIFKTFHENLRLSECLSPQGQAEFSLTSTTVRPSYESYPGYQETLISLQSLMRESEIHSTSSSQFCIQMLNPKKKWIRTFGKKIAQWSKHMYTGLDTAVRNMGLPAVLVLMWIWLVAIWIVSLP